MLKVENDVGRDTGGTTNNWFSCQRLCLCESCESAPAASLCKTDAASLFAARDSDIHSATPLARRYHRVPVPPLPRMLYSEDDFLTRHADETLNGEDDDEAASWLLLNPVKNGDNQRNGAGTTSFGGAVDEFLDLENYNSFQFNDQLSYQQQHHSVHQNSHGGDSVVPIPHHKGQLQELYFQLGLQYESSNTGFHFPAAMSQNVSLSPVDAGLVPESRTNEVSVFHTRPPKGTIDLFPGSHIQMPTQLTPLDREARVLRYREKKKTRKFEKTIRYASRKAYAEIRPRIKGRFAKRRDAEVEAGQMFSASLLSEPAYGVVPTI